MSRRRTISVKGLTFGREAGRHRRRGRAREALIHFVIFMVIVVGLVNRVPVSGLIFLHLTCVCSTSLARHQHGALVENALHILLRSRKGDEEEESHKSGDYKSAAQSSTSASRPKTLETSPGQSSARSVAPDARQARSQPGSARRRRRRRRSERMQAISG